MTAVVMVRSGGMKDSAAAGKISHKPFLLVRRFVLVYHNMDSRSSELSYLLKDSSFAYRSLQASFRKLRIFMEEIERGDHR